MELPQQKEFLGHPRALLVLCHTEFWERFAYYGMRAILVLYMVKALQYTDTKGYAIYGAFAGLVYMTPLIGGMLADRLIGSQRAIITGIILMAIGYFSMAVKQPFFFYAAIGFQIIGNGYFKANMSATIGKIYTEKDPRRDGAYTLFYMAVNLVAFVTPIVCGWIGSRFGYQYGFLTAGIGMLIGLFVFLSGRKDIGDSGAISRAEALKEPLFAGLSKNAVWYICTILSIPVAVLLVLQAEWIKYSISIFGGAFLIYIIIESLKSPRAERGGIFTIIILMVFSMSFWACFEQAGSSMTLFTERLIDRTVMGFTVATPMFQSINPLLIVLLGIPFSKLWEYLAKTRYNPSSPLKMAVGLLILGAGFFVLFIAAKLAGEGSKASIWFIVLVYFLHTTGELCFSPVGLSMVSKLSPLRLSSLLMGAWMLSSAFAHIIAGAIAALTGGDAGYAGVFRMITFFAVGASIGLIILTPLLKKLGGKNV